MFWDDNVIRVTSFDEAIEAFNHSYLEPEIDNLEKNISVLVGEDISIIANAIMGDLPDTYIIINQALFNKYQQDIRKVIQKMEENYTDIGNIFIIYDFKKLVSELTAINEIAKAENVTFFWV